MTMILWKIEHLNQKKIWFELSYNSLLIIVSYLPKYVVHENLTHVFHMFGFNWKFIPN
jgi:hypothetical protein